MLTQIYDKNKKKVGELELSDDVFAVPLKKSLIFETMIKQLANKRTGCAKTKGRGEVKCSNKKPYRQKGTGRARHGTYASPIFVGGGVTFGPRPRDYSYGIPQKARRLALKSAISMKFRDGKAIVLDNMDLAAPKTSEIKKVLDKLEVKSVLVILDKKNEAVEKSIRNIPNVKLLYHSWLDIYDILRYEHIIFTAPAVTAVQEGLKS